MSNRKILVGLILSMFFCASSIFSQGSHVLCDVPWLQNNTGGTFHVYISFYDKSSSNVLNEALVEQSLVNLASYFVGTDIFFHWDCLIQDYDENASFNGGALRVLVFESSSDSGVEWDVPTHTVEVSTGGLLGGTFAHEVGHAFGLLHPGQGDRCGSGPGDNENVPRTGPDANCEYTGDCLCDTPASPISFNSQTASTCSFVALDPICDYDPLGNAYQSDLTNIMTSLDCKTPPFTQGQINRMKNFLTYSSVSDVVIPVSNSNDIIISTDTQFGSNNYPSGLTIPGDLILQGGNNLSLLGFDSPDGPTFQVNFKENNSKIIVESGATLTIQNSIIGLSGCASFWDGILVRTGGTVIINDSHFTNFKTAVRQTNWGQSFISLTNCKFYGGDRGVALLNDNQNSNTFDNCEFINLDQGITMFSNNGLTIKDCIFQDIKEYGVNGIQSSLSIGDDCKFKEIHTGIRLTNASPSLKISDIKESEFDCTIDLYLGGTGGIRISQNNFMGSASNIWLDGENSFDISHNNLTSNGFSTILFNNGSNSGLFDLNDVQSNGIGILAYNNNPSFDFLRNCFSSEVNDVYVTGTFKDQGDDNVSNGNCFSNSTTNSTDINAIAAIPFFYFNPSQNVTHEPCQKAEGVGNILTPNVALNVLGADECGKLLLNEDNENDSETYITDPCFSVFNSVRCLCVKPIGCVIFEEIGRVISERDSLINLSTDSSENLSSLIRKYDILIQGLKMSNVRFLLASDLIPEAVDFLAQDELFSNKIKAVSILIEIENYTEAILLLNSLVPSTDEEIGFINSQIIYLTYLQNKNQYSLSEEDSITIMNNALEEGSLSTYSRSIVELLTGIVLIPELPSILNQYNIGLRNKINNLVKVYPNPVVQLLNVELDLEGKDSSLISIFDITGRELFKSTFFGQELQVDLSALDNGVYFYRVFNKQNIINEGQFIKI